MINVKMVPISAMRNRDALSKVSECACYYCCKSFPVSEIKNYVDENNTAVCPYCIYDTIIPVNCEEDKKVEVLRNIHKYWFAAG